MDNFLRFKRKQMFQLWLWNFRNFLKYTNRIKIDRIKLKNCCKNSTIDSIKLFLAHISVLRFSTCKINLRHSPWRIFRILDHFTEISRVRMFKPNKYKHWITSKQVGTLLDFTQTPHTIIKLQWSITKINYRHWMRGIRVGSKRHSLRHMHPGAKVLDLVNSVCGFYQ